MYRIKDLPPDVIRPEFVADRICHILLAETIQHGYTGLFMWLTEIIPINWHSNTYCEIAALNGCIEILEHMSTTRH